MSIKTLLSVFFTGGCLALNAQKTITAKLIDSTRTEPVPYATIQLNNEVGVVSNEKGIFNLSIQRQITKNDS